MVLQVFQHGAVPTRPVRARRKVGRPRRDELDGGVGPLHQFGAFQGELTVVFRAAVSHLPGAIHLISQSPVSHLPGLLTPIPRPQFRHRRGFRGVTILNPSLSLLPGAGTEVGAQIRFDPQNVAVSQKLVRAKAIVLHRAPGHLEARRPLVARTNAIHPVVVGREIPSRPAQQRDVESFHRFHHILAVAGGVGEFRAFVEDAAFDAAAQVLGEVSVEFAVDRAYLAVGIDLDAGD